MSCFLPPHRRTLPQRSSLSRPFALNMYVVHGNLRPIMTMEMFLQNTLPMATSPCPFWVEMLAATIFGTLVPMAATMTPMTLSEIRIRSSVRQTPASPRNPADRRESGVLCAWRSSRSARRAGETACGRRPTRHHCAARDHRAAPWESRTRRGLTGRTTFTWGSAHITG